MFTKRLINLILLAVIFGTLMLTSPMKVKAQGNTLCGYFQDDGYYYYDFYPYGKTQWIVTGYSEDSFQNTFGFDIHSGKVWIELTNPSFNRSGVLTGFDSYRRVSSCSATSNPTPTPTSDKNTRQIWFSVKGGMVHSITISGTNQNNQMRTYSRTFISTGTPTGASVVQTKERWKDFVAIDFTFKTTKIEKGRCVIDTLKITANSDYTMIQYDPTKRTCTGDSGNGASIQELDALAYAILHKDDLGIFEDIISKYGAYSCGYKFLKALANRDPKIIVKDLECPQQVVDYFLSLAPKYNKLVSVSTSSSTNSSTSNSPNSSQPKKAQISNEVYNAALRKSPGYSNKDDTDVLASIPAGSTIQILSGPKTADGLNWWNVSWNGITGWMADHTGSGKTIMIFSQ